MSAIITLFQNFIYVLTALALSVTAYGIYDRYIDRQDKKETMKSIADTTQTAISSMMGIHGVSTVKDAIRREEDREDKKDEAKAQAK